MTACILALRVNARFWRVYCYFVVPRPQKTAERTNNRQFNPKRVSWKH
jgi:hypothetical protein